MKGFQAPLEVVVCGSCWGMGLALFALRQVSLFQRKQTSLHWRPDFFLAVFPVAGVGAQEQAAKRQ